MKKEFYEYISNTQKKKITTQDWVTNILRESILNNYLEEGEPISTSILAEKLGVSRMPIRSALSQLESEGLVSLTPYKSAIPIKLSKKEVLQIYDIRSTLEKLAIKLAIENISNSQTDTLLSILEKMNNAKDSKLYQELNNEFHDSIYNFSNNPVLIDIINKLRNQVQKYLKLYLSEQCNITTANIEHQEIMNAILKRDSIMAQNAIQSHLETTCNTLIKNLSNSTLEKKL